jgi:hypothetical protein
MGMSKVLIVVNAEVIETGKIIAASPATEKMVTAIKRGIATYAPETTKMEIVAAASLWSKTPRREANERIYPKEEVNSQVVPVPTSIVSRSIKLNDRHQDRDRHDSDTIYCPLTIELPDSFDFPAKNIFSACRNVGKTRQLVEQVLGYKTSVGDFGMGHFWLPIVLTNKGPLYAEVIGEGAIPNSYEQPIDLPQSIRQSLYSLGCNLLDSISATPSVYLLQFGIRGQDIIFDRLWPFPAAPALASLKWQDPDLFTCHWYCLTNQPILELTTVPTVG